MGPNPSGVNTNFVKPYSNDLYIPITNNKNEELIPQPFTETKVIVNRTNLFKSAFCGTWSIETPETICPLPRTGHFFVTDDRNQFLYIGYGLSSEGKELNDFWSFNLSNFKWKQIFLNGEIHSPRVGSRGIFFENKILIVGGYCEPNYYFDLHYIDLNTNSVQIIHTNGNQPIPRSTPILGIYKNELFVWGGFNGEMINTLNVLNLLTLNWNEYKQDIIGRTAIPFTQINNKIYSFGSSKTGGLLELDLDLKLVQIIPTIGSEPPSIVMNAGLQKVDNYLFFFGGKSSLQWTLIYCCDLNKKWWFIFYIQPDGETATISDGAVSEIGLFLIPEVYSFALTYYPPNRKLIVTLGEPFKDPPPVFTLSIGDALSVLHLRDDMVDIFNKFL